MAEKSMKNGSKIRRMETTYIKPISAYIGNSGMPISSLYQPISKDGETPISSLYQPISNNGGNLSQAYIG